MLHFEIELVMPFLYAGDAICNAYAKMAAPLFAKLRANVDSIKTLTRLRDALLPKLISGELRVKAASRFMDAAGQQHGSTRLSAGISGR